MKNFYKCGDTLPLVMTADVVSGQLVNIGAFVGVCACAAKAGDSVEVALVGVFVLPKASADAIGEGQAVKFDPATGIITAAGTVAAGVAAQPAAAGTTSCYVRLTPGLGETVASSEAAGLDRAKHGDAKHEHAKHAEHEHVGAGKH